MGMSEYTLEGDTNSVGLNNDNTVGVMAYQHVHDDPNTVMITPKYLREWAEAVEEAFAHDRVVEIVATDDVPLIAREYDKDADTPKVGIGVAPRVTKETYKEIKNE